MRPKCLGGKTKIYKCASPTTRSSRAEPGRLWGRKQAAWLSRAQAGAPGYSWGRRTPCWASAFWHRRPRQGEGPGDGGRSWRGRPTLNTLIWQLAECKCSVYSPFSLCLKVSICTRKGTPFSPPCFLGVNSVLMQCTCRGRGGAGSQKQARVGSGPPPAHGLLSKWRFPFRTVRPTSTSPLSPSAVHSVGPLAVPSPNHRGPALSPLSLDLGGPA